MRMARASIYMKVRKQTTTQTIFRQHTFHSMFDYPTRNPVKNLTGSSKTLSTRVTRVTYVLLFRQLVAGKTDFFGVDYNDVVTAIDVRSVIGLVLTPQDSSDLTRQTTQHRVFGINNDPLLIDGRFVSRDSFVA